METTIRINTDLLNSDFVDGIKKLFPHKTVDNYYSINGRYRIAEERGDKAKGG